MVLAAVSFPRPARRARARPVGLLAALLLGWALCGSLATATANAAPPPNDAPSAPGTFEQYTAENGKPSDLQAIAEPAEATADPGVPQCLGPTSFLRTVWYVIPASDTPQDISVEAAGQTLDQVDLAAFVQPEGATGPLTVQPNACAGLGAGGANAAEEPTSGLSLRVPARRSVLVQVGRRGPIGSPDDERVVLSLDDRPAASPPSPLFGDIADAATPLAHTARETIVPVYGATITHEDPVQPPCPALGDVWRKVVPTKSEARLIRANGTDAATLTVFSGASPTADNALDCVNRAGRGAIEMVVQAKARKPLWIRVGTDQPGVGAAASVFVGSSAGTFVVDGGPGGSDPTPGGPGGGLPDDCSKADAGGASIAGAPFAGKVKQLNSRGALTIPITLNRGPVCDVAVALVGPRARVYARGRMLRLKGGRLRLRLNRVGRLAPGRYGLQVTALSRLGDHVRVRSSLRGKLT
jgi:hypothetical protein